MGRTILFGADVDLVAAYSVSCSGEGQHLDTVVGVFLQTLQLQLGLLGSDVSDFPKFCSGINNKTLKSYLRLAINSYSSLTVPR